MKNEIKSSIPNKLKLSEEAFSRLRMLKSRTGMEDWTLARLGLCFSLGDTNTKDLKNFLESNSTKEFNRYTLTGDKDLLYTELVRSYAHKYVGGKMGEGDIMRAHLNRGIISLSRQIKSLSDLAQLMAKKSKA